MPGSGPGGRWFKSIRPDQFFQALTRDSRFFVYSTVDDFVVDRFLDVQHIRILFQFPSLAMAFAVGSYFQASMNCENRRAQPSFKVANRHRTVLTFYPAVDSR